LTVTGVPVSQASELLGASYRLYRHATTNETIVRTLGYALPVVLIPHVLAVAPTTFFASTGTLRMTPRRRTFVPAVASAEEASGEPVRALSNREDTVPQPVHQVTPSTLTWLYNTFAYKPAATDKNEFGIAGFLPEYPSRTDLTRFMKEFCTGADDATFEVVRVNGGGYNSKDPGIEGNLNTQYASAITYPTPQTWWSIGGQTQIYVDTGEPAPGDVFLEWFNFILDQPKIPQTISTSYGTDEKDCPLEYAEVLCKLFAQLGAHGVSVLYASGDDGVGAGNCKGDDGQVQFIPLFPASCTYGVLSILASHSPDCHGFVGPYVTSVGGTTGALPESAAELSGGGFSNIFPRPKYQKKAVPAFLRKLGRQYAGFYKCVFFCNLI
jgi:tripeptidyl-peptidase-1